MKRCRKTDSVNFEKMGYTKGAWKYFLGDCFLNYRTVSVYECAEDKDMRLLIVERAGRATRLAQRVMHKDEVRDTILEDDPYNQIAELLRGFAACGFGYGGDDDNIEE